jgi:hypothetical protein
VRHWANGLPHIPIITTTFALSDLGEPDEAMGSSDIVDLVPFIASGLLLTVLTAFLWYVFRPRNHHSLRSVAILVLGDIGRSPRMMYHAQSFAENDFVTDLVGYGGTWVGGGCNVLC